MHLLSRGVLSSLAQCSINVDGCFIDPDPCYDFGNCGVCLLDGL